MTKKKTNWALLGAIAGVCAAPFTGGTSLGIATAACGGLGFVGGKVVEKALDDGGGGNESDISNKLKELEIKNQEWKTQVEANRVEVERLRQERQKDENKINKNNQELERLRAILNNPNTSEEEKSNARKKILLLEGENRKLKEKNRERGKKIEEKSKTPPTPSSSLSYNFPKLSRYDKLIIAAVLVLLIYFLFLRDSKNK